MRIRFCCLLVLSMLVMPLPGHTATDRHVAIAAAADMHYAMGQLVASCRQDHPADTVDVTYGAFGQMVTQIEQVAPFELFLSADE